MLKNDGFLLNDALISVLITSLISVIVYSCIVVHVKIQEKLQEESQMCRMILIVSGNRSMRNNRGTVLIDYLLTLIIVMMIPVIILSISTISHALKQPYCLQDLVATYQLRRILVLSYSPHIEEDALYFTYKKKEMKLSLINENIILTPGTQILYRCRYMYVL